MWTRKFSEEQLGAAAAGWLLLALMGLAAAGGSSWAAGPSDGRGQPGGATYVEAFQGKLVCSLKRPALMNLKGTISKLWVREGQRVKKGDVLAEYELAPEMIPPLKRRVAGGHLRDLELQVAEMDKNMASLKNKGRELHQLAALDLAPAQGLSQVEREIQVAEKQRALLLQKLRFERDAYKEDLEILRDGMGGSLKPIESSEPVRILAPIDGQVIWIAPELREDAELPPGTQAFMIGVMDPMLMRAQVHELEAVKIAVGDLADVTFDSIPNRVFEARVLRVSWAPLTPAVEQPTYYSLELSVANPDLDLREGLKGQVSLHKQPER